MKYNLDLDTLPEVIVTHKKNYYSHLIESFYLIFGLCCVSGVLLTYFSEKKISVLFATFLIMSLYNLYKAIYTNRVRNKIECLYKQGKYKYAIHTDRVEDFCGFSANDTYPRTYPAHLQLKRKDYSVRDAIVFCNKFSVDDEGFAFLTVLLKPASAENDTVYKKDAVINVVKIRYTEIEDISAGRFLNSAELKESFFSEDIG